MHQVGWSLPSSVIALPLAGCLKMTPSESHRGQPQCLEWVQGVASVRVWLPLQTGILARPAALWEAAETACLQQASMGRV